MKLVFSLVLICSTLFSSAQDIAGLWRGRFTSNHPLQQITEYKYELLLFQDGNKISGYSYSTVVNGEFYAVCEIAGNLFEGYMVITETKTLYQNPSGSEGVLQSHILFLNSDTKEVSGEWKQSNKRKTQLFEESGKTFLKKEDDPSKSGLIKVLEQKNAVQVEKPSAPEQSPILNKDSIKLSSRTVEIVKSIETNADSVLIELYDDGLIDGDSVSVFTNNSILLNRIGLSDKGIKQTIALPKTEEGLLLILFAENQGTIPPNTGVLVVKTGGLVYEIRFKSDNKKSAAVRITRK
ncbi:hypothetical protein [Lacibacter sp.]|uniref:hypothetical protein n=1 Tax=Lacibacter sp. TaxID=1915409 RepID=UPI002B4B7F9C|nr:hypothetical protein [Lacibacter sp.]HLP36795.1 hypothetical protein [Lacibacter sp.]